MYMKKENYQKVVTKQLYKYCFLLKKNSSPTSDRYDL